MLARIVGVPLYPRVCTCVRVGTKVHGHMCIPPGIYLYVREWITLLSGLHRILWQVDRTNENARCDTYVRYVYVIAVVLRLLPSTTVSAVMRTTRMQIPTYF